MGTVEQWNSRFYKFLLYGREMLLKDVISQEKKVGQVFHCSTVPLFQWQLPTTPSCVSSLPLLALGGYRFYKLKAFNSTQ